MSELPAGWMPQSARELFSLVTSGSRGWAKYYSESGAAFIRMGNLNRGTINLDTRAVQRVTVPPTSEGARTRLRQGDLLVSITAELGMVALVPDSLGEAYINQHVALMRPVEGVDSRFLAYFLVNDVECGGQIIANRRGATKASLGLNDLRGLSIPLPPLPEQQGIADRLDALLARVDACRERLERLPRLTARLRQATYSAAMTGALTAKWRRERGRSLREWNRISLGSLISRVEAGLNVQCEERPPESSERGLVKISAVTWGSYDESQSKTLRPGHTVPESARISPGDFLISRANTLELVGACVIVEHVSRNLFLSDKVLRLVMPAELKSWVLCALRSEMGRRQIQARASGNQLSMRNLSQVNLRAIEVPLPPEDERAEVVRIARALLAKADRLETLTEAAGRRTGPMVAAILRKAFRGELVPQDAGDEPAGAVLARARGARTEPSATSASRVRLIRFGGHLPKGEYDGHHDGAQGPTDTAELHRGLQGRGDSAGAR